MRPPVLAALAIAVNCAGSTPAQKAEPADGGAPVVFTPPSFPRAAAPEPGASRTSVEGCAATPGEEPPASHQTRAFVPDQIEIEPVAGGIAVDHHHQHACCLKASIDVSRDDRIVTVRESLAGEPCRCLCRSTLRSVIGVPAGSFTVRVVVVESGRERKVAERVVEVGGP